MEWKVGSLPLRDACGRGHALLTALRTQDKALSSHLQLRAQDGGLELRAVSLCGTYREVLGKQQGYVAVEPGAIQLNSATAVGVFDQGLSDGPAALRLLEPEAEGLLPKVELTFPTTNGVHRLVDAPADTRSATHVFLSDMLAVEPTPHDWDSAEAVALNAEVLQRALRLALLLAGLERSNTGQLTLFLEIAAADEVVLSAHCGYCAFVLRAAGDFSKLQASLEAAGRPWPFVVGIPVSTLRGLRAVEGVLKDEAIVRLDVAYDAMAVPTGVRFRPQKASDSSWSLVLDCDRKGQPTVWRALVDRPVLRRVLVPAEREFDGYAFRSLLRSMQPYELSAVVVKVEPATPDGGTPALLFDGSGLAGKFSVQWPVEELKAAAGGMELLLNPKQLSAAFEALPPTPIRLDVLGGINGQGDSPASVALQVTDEGCGASIDIHLAVMKG